MPLALGDRIGCAYIGTWESQKYMYTHTWKVALTTSTQTLTRDLLDITNAFAQNAALTLLSLYRACLATDYTINENTAQRISPQRSVKVTRVMADAGQGGGAAKTGNVAAVFTLKTINAGRSQVANKHVGPIADADYSAGKVGGALNTALAVFAARHLSSYSIPLTSLENLVLVPIIYHRQTATDDLTDSMAVSDRIGTMRRRTLRVGE